MKLTIRNRLRYLEDRDAVRHQPTRGKKTRHQLCVFHTMWCRKSGRKDLKGLRGVLNPVLILQDGLDVGVGDDHVVQLQLRQLALGLHGSDQIHRGSGNTAKEPEFTTFPHSRLMCGCRQSHRLGVEVVQQVVGVAVAVSAHHDQGNEGSQENGGQHPDGHNHHRLHGDSGSRGGWRLQLELRVQSGSSDCLSSSTNGCSPAEAESERETLMGIWEGDQAPHKA